MSKPKHAPAPAEPVEAEQPAEVESAAPAPVEQPAEVEPAAPAPVEQPAEVEPRRFVALTQIGNLVMEGASVDAAQVAAFGWDLDRLIQIGALREV